MLALYIVAGIGLFVLLVFSIPVDMVFDVGRSGAARSRMRVGWLFALTFVSALGSGLVAGIFYAFSTFVSKVGRRRVTPR